ncbi:uncharacterized protein c9h2orf80 [Fundulus diaphanus]
MQSLGLAINSTHDQLLLVAAQLSQLTNSLTSVLSQPVNQALVTPPPADQNAEVCNLSPPLEDGEPERILPPSCSIGAIQWDLEDRINQALRLYPDPGTGPAGLKPFISSLSGNYPTPFRPPRSSSDMSLDYMEFRQRYSLTGDLSSSLRGNYIGQKIREESFDPTGRGSSTMLDDLAHYDLAIGVAFWWLNKDEGRDGLDTDIIGATSSFGSPQYLNRLEREALILSSFAGIIMSSLPVEEILALYRCKPAASYPSHHFKGSIVCPFTLSHHPFAMLSSYKAVQHSKKHNQKLKRWLSQQTKASALQRPVSAQSSSPSVSESFVSENSDCHQEAADPYEGSQESLQD